VGRATLTPSLQALLAGLIDYAGLFPPASLPMAEAVTRYARYRRGPHAWMLGRFIVPRQRFGEFEAQLQQQSDAARGSAADRTRDAAGGRSRGEDSPAGPASPWPVAVLTSDDLAGDAAAIEAFNARRAQGTAAQAVGADVLIDTVEGKVAAAADVRRIAGMLPQGLQLWFEIAPTDAAFDAMLRAIADIGPRAGAKLRTGGVTAEAIPPPELVAQFLIACARTKVSCKATAGLHHPVRAAHRLTYADDSPTALMHGFVNLFLAAALARAGADATLLVALLEERDARHFAWHDDHVIWKGHRVDAATLASARATFARSFGSCSFDEPVDDLRRLGWL
jgi:hypothetical protein